MALHSLCYLYRCFPRFVSVGWGPTWGKCANHAITRQQNLSNCIPCQCHTYMRCLSTFSGCGWANGLTIIPLPPQTLPQICQSWVKSYLVQVCKPCHYALIKAVEPFKLHPMSMHYIHEVFEHLLRLWMGIWLCIHIITTTDASPDLWELDETLPDASVQTMPLRFRWGCRTFQLHLMYMSYIYEVFEHLLRLWMGIWLHTHNITTTDVSPDLWELAEILPDASVQTMPLCFDWGCRTFQIASHVNVIVIQGVWAPSHIVDGHMDSHSHHYHHRHFPRFVRAGWNPTWCKCANHATTLRLRL